MLASSGSRVHVGRPRVLETSNHLLDAEMLGWVISTTQRLPIKATYGTRRGCAGMMVTTITHRSKRFCLLTLRPATTSFGTGEFHPLPATTVLVLTSCLPITMCDSYRIRSRQAMQVDWVQMGSMEHVRIFRALMELGAPWGPRMRAMCGMQPASSSC